MAKAGSDKFSDIQQDLNELLAKAFASAKTFCDELEGFFAGVEIELDGPYYLSIIQLRAIAQDPRFANEDYFLPLTQLLQHALKRPEMEKCFAAQSELFNLNEINAYSEAIYKLFKLPMSNTSLLHQLLQHNKIVLLKNLMFHVQSLTTVDQAALFLSPDHHNLTPLCYAIDDTNKFLDFYSLGDDFSQHMLPHRWNFIHFLAFHNKSEILYSLAVNWPQKFSALLNQTDDHGLTPLDIAYLNHHQDSILVLKARDAETSQAQPKMLNMKSSTMVILQIANYYHALTAKQLYIMLSSPKTVVKSGGKSAGGLGKKFSFKPDENLFPLTPRFEEALKFDPSTQRVTILDRKKLNKIAKDFANGLLSKDQATPRIERAMICYTLLAVDDNPKVAPHRKAAHFERIAKLAMQQQKAQFTTINALMLQKCVEQYGLALKTDEDGNIITRLTIAENYWFRLLLDPTIKPKSFAPAYCTILIEHYINLPESISPEILQTTLAFLIASGVLPTERETQAAAIRCLIEAYKKTTDLHRDDAFLIENSECTTLWKNYNADLNDLDSLWKLVQLYFTGLFVQPSLTTEDNSQNLAFNLGLTVTTSLLTLYLNKVARLQDDRQQKTAELLSTYADQQTRIQQSHLRLFFLNTIMEHYLTKIYDDEHEETRQIFSALNKSISELRQKSRLKTWPERDFFSLRETTQHLTQCDEFKSRIESLEQDRKHADFVNPFFTSSGDINFNLIKKLKKQIKTSAALNKLNELMDLLLEDLGIEILTQLTKESNDLVTAIKTSIDYFVITECWSTIRIALALLIKLNDEDTRKSFAPLHSQTETINIAADVLSYPLSIIKSIYITPPQTFGSLKSLESEPVSELDDDVIVEMPPLALPRTASSQLQLRHRALLTTPKVLRRNAYIGFAIGDIIVAFLYLLPLLFSEDPILGATSAPEVLGYLALGGILGAAAGASGYFLCGNQTKDSQTREQTIPLWDMREHDRNSPHPKPKSDDDDYDSFADIPPHETGPKSSDLDVSDDQFGSLSSLPPENKVRKKKDEMTDSAFRLPPRPLSHLRRRSLQPTALITTSTAALLEDTPEKPSPHTRRRSLAEMHPQQEAQPAPPRRKESAYDPNKRRSSMQQPMMFAHEAQQITRPDQHIRYKSEGLHPDWIDMALKEHLGEAKISAALTFFSDDQDGYADWWERQKSKFLMQRLQEVQQNQKSKAIIRQTDRQIEEALAAIAEDQSEMRMGAASLDM